MSAGDSRPSAPRVSVVIPAYNAAATLADSVTAVLGSSAALHEIIIADDASDDGAPAACESLDARVRVVRTGDTPLGPARARNMAAKAATGDVVAFVDADVRVHVDTLERLIAPMVADQNIVASFGSYDDAPPAPAVAALYANLRHHSVHQSAPTEAMTFWSGLGAVRRDAFLAVGGFDVAFGKPSIEDVELGTRLREKGGTIRLVHHAQATHLKAWTVRGLWRTDIMARALPWARLSVDRPELLASLNAGAREKLAALCLAGGIGSTALTLPASAWVPWWIMLLAAIAFLAWWSVLNRRLLGLLFKRGGPRGLIGGAVLHAVYYGYGVGAYVLGGSAFRWASCWRKARGSSLLWAVLLGGLGSAGLVCLGLGLVDTDALLARLSALERDASSLRYTRESLIHVQNKLLVFGGVLVAMAGSMAIASPAWLATELQSLPTLAKERFGVVREHRLMLMALTTLLALCAGLNLTQQMRMDEASSYAMYATTSPLVALLTYETTNNHVLHSALMWASVNLFGVHAWAVRLPAYIVSLTLPWLLYCAGRRLLTPHAGLIAAALASTAGYSLELATNARGYPMVLASFLILLTIMPDLRNGRGSAALIAIVAGIVGLYAVPVMAYPLAIVYVSGLFLRPLGAWPSLLRLVRTGVMTCIGVLILYMPAWVTRVERTQSPSASPDLPSGPDVPDATAPLIDTAILEYNLEAALAQFVYPADGVVSLGITLGIAAGGVACLARGAQSRAVVLGVLIGVPSVFALTRFQTLPWWTLAWVWPLVLLALGALFAPAMNWLGAHRRGVLPSTILVTALLPGIAAWSAGYPKDFPFWVGHRDSPAVADALTDLSLSDSHLVASSAMFRTLNYELNARGIAGRPAIKIDDLRAPVRPRVIRVVGDVEENELATQPFREDIRDRLILQTEIAVGRSVIEVYTVRRQTE